MAYGGGSGSSSGGGSDSGKCQRRRRNPPPCWRGCRPPPSHSSSSSASPFPFSSDAALIANAASPPSMVPSMVGCCVAHSVVCQPHHHDCLHLMPRMRDVGTREVQSELLRLNVRTRQFCGRDPDTKNVVSLFGLETTNKVSVSWMVYQVSCARIFESHNILLDVPLAGLLQIDRTLWGDPEDEIWKTR